MYRLSCGQNTECLHDHPPLSAADRALSMVAKTVKAQFCSLSIGRVFESFLVRSKEAERIRPDLCVLYMTGYSRNAVFHQGRLDEGVDLLQKPISEAQLE